MTGRVTRLLFAPFVAGLLGLAGILGERLGAARQKMRDDAETARLAQLVASYRAELRVMDDLWIECVLRDPIRFPADTAVRPL